MTGLVVDASVAAMWFTEETFSRQALSILDGGFALHAPDFLSLEFDSLLCKWIRRGVMSETEGESVHSAMKRIPVRYHKTSMLQDAAVHLANKTHRAFYDCIYVALALSLDGRMITADRKLYNALADSPLSEQLLWVGDV